MDKLEAELARLRKLKGKKLTSMMKSTREEIQKLLEVHEAGRCFVCLVDPDRSLLEM